MSTTIVSAATREAGGALIESLSDRLGTESPRLVFLFASPALGLGDLAARAHARFPGAVVLSASTSGEFTERGETRGGASALAVCGEHRAFGGIASGLKADPEGAVRRALEGLPLEVEGFPHCTAFLHVDALAGTGEEATLIAAELLGEDTQIAGAAAGDDLAMTATQVGVGAHVAGDSVGVALLFSVAPLAIGVAHAHAPISPPLRVTRAEGNVVHTIEDRPAWDVWREYTRERAKAQGIDVDALAKDEVIGYLLRFEAGLQIAADSGDPSERPAYKIRAPLSTGEGGSIAFACGIPQGTVIRITESSKEGQRSSARLAAEIARVKLEGRAAAGAVVFDCICRRLILDAEFEQAVGAIGETLGGVPVAGFETYGEIAMQVGDLSGFHNTTSVVVAFPS